MNKVQFKSAEAAAVVTVDRTAAAAARKLYYTAVASRSTSTEWTSHFSVSLSIRSSADADPLPPLVASVLGGGGGGRGRTEIG